MSSLEWTFAIIGFALSSYSVVGNDVIQTLGTFICSNKSKRWLHLWLYIGGLMAVLMIYAYYTQGGDVSYGRLDKIEFPEYFHWWYILPPIILLVITHFGWPVSTTFLILSLFQSKMISDMLLKSVFGYLLAFAFAGIFYYLIAETIEKKFLNKENKSPQLWTVLQWCSTGFLWSIWLIQDLANIFVYLPRPLSPIQFWMGLGGLLVLLAVIFAIKGGRIQRIVNTKTNTSDIRSATIIDFCYGLILFFFTYLSTVPMSTTWVFIGLLGGRELALRLRFAKEEVASNEPVFGIILKDLLKAVLGILMSIALVVLINYLQGRPTQF